MRLIRYAICALLAFGVLAFGGVEPWARAVLETGSGVIFLAWALYAYFQRRDQLSIPPLLLPLAAFALVVLAQWLLHRTASAYHTRLEFQLLIADLLILFVAAQVFRTTTDWRGFAWFLMVFAFLVSGFGILQHLTFNGKLYWFRDMRYGGIPFGPYANRNHFAGFAELAIPAGLVPLALGKVRRERRVFVAFLAILPLAALFLSASRGGIISVGVELFVLTMLLILRRSLGKHAIVGAAVLVLALVMVSWLGVKQILARFTSLQTLEVSQAKRASMRLDSWHIFLGHPLMGTGLGTLQTVYPQYETLYDGKIVNHAHNDYLEALAETGTLGGLCCASFLGILFLLGFARIQQANSSFEAALHITGLTACSGFLTHSLADFNLHIPANALLFFLVALLATASMEAPSLAPATAPRLRSRNP